MRAAFLALCVVLEAVQQGIIVWVLREFCPKRYQGVNLAAYTGFALHVLGVVSYLAVAAFLAPAEQLVSVRFWLVVLLLRVCLFDVSLNLTRNYVNRVFDRPWEPLFSVGTSSLTDKSIQVVAKLVRLNPTILSALVRVAATAALVALLLG